MKKDVWVARIIGYKAKFIATMFDLRTEWVNRGSLSDNIDSIDDFLKEGSPRDENGILLRDKDIVIAKVNDQYLLATFNGKNFTEVARYRQHDYVRVWAKQIREMVKSIADINSVQLATSKDYIYESAASSQSKMYYDGDECILLKTSEISPAVLSEFPYYKNLIASMIKNDAIMKHPLKPGQFLLKKDFNVKSPSAAATLVSGRNINGHYFWKHGILETKLGQLLASSKSSNAQPLN